MNKVILIGRLTKDPQTRYTQSGVAVTTFTIAVDRKYAKKDSGQPTADFIPVVCWRKLAEIVGNNLAKGRQVGIEGAMQVRTYDGDDGKKRYVTEVIADEVEFLGRKQDGGNNAPYDAPEIADETVPF